MKNFLMKRGLNHPCHTRYCSSIRGKAARFLLLIAGICSMMSAGCSEKQGPPDFQLNLNPPQIEGKIVTVNGGVIAPVERIQWDWGDGTKDSHLFFPATHTYSSPGHYTITVTVVDGKNYTAAKSVMADIKP